MTGVVTAVSRSGTHTMSKPREGSITLREGLGVDGDAHLGVTVKHRSRVAKDPTVPNLRQVHLIHAELHDELRAAGLELAPGEMGENVTTRGVDLLGLPTGARLRLGAAAVVEVTGLRNPCHQLNGLRPGLMAATLDRDAEGNLVRKAGIMGIVIVGGEIRPGDAIAVELPPSPHTKLEAV
ncbi:MAG TPA: MOSC domain-containing protein [Stellaceae bacterium]|jgi:MOSC domain-containing protein YiiM|nr:MOSC domain-containing protein [Stellaceae bacterium]